MTFPRALSALDLAWIRQGSDPGAALAESCRLAQHLEGLGYTRYWLAEHHSIPTYACCATPVVLAHVAAATHTIRIGSGGVMLPNHSPLVVAEQFGTLDALHPGRIDLGLGRAPGTDSATQAALRRREGDQGGAFEQDILELQSYFASAATPRRVIAIPAMGRKVPVWILGSSTHGATIAARLGLPYAYAAHFAPMTWMPPSLHTATSFSLPLHWIVPM